MKEKRKKRLLALLIASIMIVTTGLTDLGPVFAADYVDSCTSYDSYIDVKANTNTAIMSMPCDAATNSSSSELERVASGTVLHVSGVYKNSIGEYWYEIQRYGNTCYVKGVDTTLIEQKTGDVTIKDVVSPSSLGYGKYFSIGGTITSSENTISKVRVSMYPKRDLTQKAVLEASATVNGYSYTLNGSSIDNALTFNTLSPGTYTYVIIAEVISNYVSSSGALTKIRKDVILEEKMCVVTDAVNSSTAKYFGIDVSTWQEVDWATTSQHIDFAIFRSSFATTTDTEFYNNLNGCEAYDVPFGLYVYSYAETVEEAREEAEYAVSLIQGHDMDLPIFFDMEDPVVAATSTSMKEAMLIEFCTVVQEAGYQAGLYTGLSWLEGYFGSSSYIHSIPIWCAQWYNYCQYTGGVHVWQYSETGSIPGIAGTVDTNYYYGELPGRTTDTSYLTKCTTYPSNVTIKTNAATTVKKYPCQFKVDTSSTDVTTLDAGTSLHATALYKNTLGEYWYQVEEGEAVGYVPATSVTFVKTRYSDVTIVDPAMADNLNAGSSFSIKGQLNSQYNTMHKVNAKVYKGEQTTGTAVISSSDTIDAKHYDLYGSNVDWNLPFGSLTAGYYTYEVTATLKNYYISSTNTLEFKTRDLVVWNKPFTVGGTTISHTHTAGDAVQENIVEGTSYESVTYCTECGAELSRDVVYDTTVEVAVTSISLNKTTLSLTEGDTATLTATVKPTNATNKTVSWGSSDTSVATVDSKGKITAVKAGSTTITATAGNKSATCLVTVAKSSTTEPETPGTGGNTEVSEGTFYNSYINVTTNAAVSLMSNPWSYETNSSSTVIANVAADTVLFVEGLYKNTIGEYWYKVVYYGNTCYVKADTATFKDHKTGDVTATDIYSPASLGYGKSFSIGGKITSTMNALSKVTAAVYPGSNMTKEAEISASASASNNSYNLSNSTIDYNLPFGSLAHGEHKYVVSADAVSYYIAADGTLTSSMRTVILEEKQCIVTNAVNSSTADYFGIDVSTWQSVDWATTSQYIDFAIFRSSFSTITDSEFYNNLAGCEKYGVPFGMYVYSYADTVDEAIAEAEHVVSIIKGHDVALPIYFDMEDPVVDATSNSTKEAMLKAFCEVIQEAGYEAGLYTGLSWLDYYFGSSTYIHTIPIWCAQWYSQCQYTGGVRMWQYSETGSIPGISGTVDTNYYYGELPGKSTDTSYLSKCTSYPSNLTVSTNATTTIKKYPCYYAVDSSSTDVADVAADTELHATAVYKNTNGEYWYQVENGTYAGYISASNASVTAFIYDDVTVVSPSMANNINVGSAYSIAGELNSQYNKMSKVHASVYSGEQTTATPIITSNAEVNDSYYDLYNSLVDWNLSFGKLTEGYYTYEISADVTNYYVSGTTLTSQTENVVVWTKPFTVGNASVEIPDSGEVTPDPTPDPQPATVTISGHTVPSSITVGGVFTVAGTITASENLTNVTVGCYDASGNVATSSSATPNATTYDIGNLDNYIEFNTLTAGTYTYKVTATTATGGTVTLVDEAFTVKSASAGTTDDSLKVTNLIVPGSYDEGMTFDIAGTVTADSAITEVTVGIYDENGNAISVGKANPNATNYNLSGLNGSVDFASLTYGTYYYKITATTAAGSKVLYNDTFTVYPERDYTIIYDYNVPEVLVEGEDFELEGTIVTQGSMTRVNIGVYDVNGNGMAFVTYEPKNTKFHFEYLEESLDFSTLAPGMYYYRIIVISDLKGIERIIDYPFVVLSKDQTVADGTYSFVPYTNSGFAIQVKGKSNNSGANVELGTKASTKYQALNVKYVGDGYYTLQFVGSGKNLTVTNAGTVIGTNVKQSTYTGSDAQLWQILPMGDSYFLVPKHAPDLCLTVADGNVAGSNINLSLKDLTDDKRYTLVATDGTYSDDVVEAPENFKLSGATLQLENDITVIIKTKVAYVGDLLNPYVIVEQELQNGEIKTTRVEGVLSSDGTEYHFLYEGLEACQVGDDFVATIYAYDTNGNLVKGGQSAPYSAKKYCTSMFKKTATQLGISETKFAKMKTLLVDLLNYSAAAQKYFAYKTDTLVNADLSAELQALASLDSVLDSVENHTEIAYEKIDNPTVTWKGATLILLNKVYVRVNLQYAGDVSNIKAVFEFEGGESYEVTEFTEYGDGLYYADFDQVTAFQMGVPICIKIMEGDNVISDTARYSVSSYVYRYKDDETAGEVVREMMKYGMAAVTYKVTE